MNILPREIQGFSDKSYWNSFFTSKRGKEKFEWYGEYTELASLLHKYITVKDHVLVVGCGNSTLSFDLHNTGIQNQTSIDISPVVVNQMKKKYPALSFAIEDVGNMSYEDSKFSVVLDKGTFDALTQPSNLDNNKPKSKSEEEDNNATELNISEKMLKEIERVLRLSGRFICVSLLQPFVAKVLFTYFVSRGWMTRVHRCHEAEMRNKDESGGGGLCLPVYLIVFTKFKKMEGVEPRIELATGDDSHLTKIKSLEDLLSGIAEQQTLACVIRSLGELGGTCCSNGFTFATTTPEGIPRYKLSVVDCPKYLRNPVEKRFAVLIVPEGREHEYMFACHEGRLELALQSGFCRLLVVAKERGQIYPPDKKISDELLEGIRMCTPKSVLEKKHFKPPVLTIGGDADERRVVSTGRSNFIGEYVVEDLKYVDTESKKATYLRRLIFVNNPNGIQSEVELIPVSDDNSLLQKFEFSTCLSCDHHGVQCYSFGMLKYFHNIEDNLSCVILGMGGGLMAKFIRQSFPKVNLTAVEIDPEIAKVAKDYFGLPETSGQFRVVIDDAINFIQTSTDVKYNVILVDVNNDTAINGLQCPPAIFVEKHVLQAYKDILSPEGILCVNVCCRNPTLKKEIVDRICEAFPFVYQFQCTEDINALIFCFMEVPNISPKTYKTTLEKCIGYVTEAKKVAHIAQILDIDGNLLSLIDGFTLLKP